MAGFFRIWRLEHVSTQGVFMVWREDIELSRMYLVIRKAKKTSNGGT
jgi:hypothetical protein